MDYAGFCSGTAQAEYGWLLAYNSQSKILINTELSLSVIPAYAGIQKWLYALLLERIVIPAYAGIQ